MLTCTSFWMSQDGLIRGKKWSNGQNGRVFLHRNRSPLTV